MVKLYKVSVIVPTIARPTLKNTLQSIKNSANLQETEILVCCCKRHCIDIYDTVKQFIPYMKIRIITSECDKTMTPAESKNLGLSHAQGKYVTFLDDDDIAYKEKFSTLSRFLDENEDYFACFGQYNVRNLQGEVTNTNCGGNKEVNINTIINDNYIASGSIMLRNKGIVFPDVPFGFGEDWELWISIVAQHKVEFIPVVVYAWTRNIENGFTATFKKKGIDFKQLTRDTKERAIKKWMQ